MGMSGTNVQPAYAEASVWQALTCLAVPERSVGGSLGEGSSAAMIWISVVEGL